MSVVESAMFTTPLEISGPLRSPRNLLLDQTYGDHASIHDPATAQQLGVAGAAVEGPTHFSQYDPLAMRMWGEDWLTSGCLSAHFAAICLDGEQTRASAAFTGRSAQIRTLKEDGTLVLSGTATLGDEPTALEERLARLRPLERPVIFEGWTAGRKGARPEHVRMGFDTHMGDLYPFTLRRKLETITETSAWYTGSDNPWGRPILPIEMISVLSMATWAESGLTKAEPSVGLFLDLQIKLLGSPVFVDAPYTLDREIVALGESRRTESAWVRTTVTCETSGSVVAEVLLHQGVFKESYPNYPA